MEDLRRLLSRSLRTASRHFRAQLAEFELSGSQATAILFLSEREGATVRELAGALSADLATASALVDRLMSQGWVRRETDPTDRRRARLLLTEKARDVVQPLTEATQRTNALLVEALGAEQASELASILARLVDRLDEQSMSAAASRKDAGEA